MKRLVSFVAIAALAVLGTTTALRAQDTDPGYYGAQGNMMDSSACDATCGYDVGCGGCDVGCGGCDISCGGCDVGCGAGYCGFGCGPYYGTGYGYGLGYCVGECGCLEGIFNVVLTPVHWVAGLLSCGSYGDCGCAPLSYHPYCNPCDSCGNWVGGADCSSYGCYDCYGDGSYSAMPSNNYGNYGAMPYNSNGFDFGKVEPVGGRNPNPAPQFASVPQRGYRYTESNLSFNRVPNRPVNPMNQYTVAASAPSQFSSAAPASVFPANKKAPSANMKMAYRNMLRNGKRVAPQGGQAIR